MRLCAKFSVMHLILKAEHVAYLQYMDEEYIYSFNVVIALFVVRHVFSSVLLGFMCTS